MKKRKFSYRLISLLLSLLVLSACGKSDTQSPIDPDSSSAADGYRYNGQSPVVKEQKKLSILTTNGASLVYDFDNMKWWQEILKRANIKVDMELVDAASYKDVVKPRLAAANNLPDIVAVGSMDNDMSYINSGIFMDLTDYYEKYGYNLKEQFKQNPALKAQLTTPDGKIYYVPYIYLTKDWARCIMVNQPWLNELGMEQPKTTDELYAVLKAIKNTDLNHNGKNDEIPLFMRAGMTQLFGTLWGLDLSVGYKADSKGVVTFSFEQPAYLDFLKYFNRLYKEGLLYSEFPTANLDTQTALFHNNQIGTILHFMSNCTGYSRQINPNWVFNKDEPIMQPILPPKGPYGDAYYYGRDGLGSIFGITKDCKDPETAFCFMDYLFSKEATELSWYGFEGIDYNIVEGNIKFSDIYLKNENNYRSNCGYNFSGFPSVQISGSYGATQCDAIMKANSIIREHVVNPIGFSYNLPDELDVVQAYQTDLNTYVNEMFVAFITGSTPLSEWDNYLKNLKAMHVKDVVAVYQATVDRQSKSAK